MAKRIVIIISCSILFVFLSSCLPIPNKTEKVIERQTVANRSIPILTPTIQIGAITPTTPFIEAKTPTSSLDNATLSAIPSKTYTPVPTLNNEQREKAALDMLRGTDDCSLPCFWDINPGVSEFFNVRGDLMQKGFRFLGPFGNGFSTGMDFTEYRVVLNIGFLITDDLVESISVSIAGDDLPHIKPEYIISNLVNSLGEPTRIWLTIGFPEGVKRTGYTFWLFYDEKGIAIKYNGLAIVDGTDLLICPNDPNRFIKDPGYQDYGIKFLLKSVRDPKPLDEMYGLFGEKIPEFTHDIELVSDMTPGVYFKIMAKNASEDCFRTKKDKWVINR